MVSVVFLRVIIYAVYLESACVKNIAILSYIQKMQNKKEQNLNANCHFINDNQSSENKEALQHANVLWADHMVLSKIIKLLLKDLRDLHSLPIL